MAQLVEQLTCQIYMRVCLTMSLLRVRFLPAALMEKHINNLIELCQIARLRYDLFDLSLPSNISGRCDYKNSKIVINEPNVKQAIMTMAHEMGHYFSYLKNLDKDFNKEKRERLAYLYGWGILKYIKAPISKQAWRQH